LNSWPEAAEEPTETDLKLLPSRKLQIDVDPTDKDDSADGKKTLKQNLIFYSYNNFFILR